MLSDQLKPIRVGIVAVLAMLIVAGRPAPVCAEDEAAAENADASPADDAPDPLDTRQANLARRYTRFEKTLLQMAEYMRKTEPERAELLVRAIAKSKENRIADQMSQIAGLLKSEQFGDAVEQESELVGHLKSLLELLQSEDRKSEIEREKERIGQLLKDVRKLIGNEKDVRAATERGGPTERLSDRQQDVAEDARRVVEKIDEHDQAQSASGEAGKPDGESNQDSQEQPGDSRPGAENPQRGKPDESDPGEQQPGESQPGEEQDPQDGRDGSGQSQPGSPSQGSPSGQSGGESPTEPQQTPGRDEIERARQEMQRAIERLQKQDRREASNRQDEAIAQLQRAKDKLEEILRQLREEELELLLAALEARFQKMLAEQWLIYNGTVALDKTPKPEWGDRHFGRARELARKQDEAALDAAKALTLLKEEGSSVAFPEAVEQLHADMLTVARRLDQTNTADLTQALERDIIEALEELIEALQKEMEKKRKDEQSQPMESGQPPEAPLVDTLAELKMLRTLQLRVNRRTRRMGELIAGDQAVDPDVVGQLRELAQRQSRIEEATHDLATGKNK